MKNFPGKKCFRVVKHQNIVHAECRYLWKSVSAESTQRFICIVKNALWGEIHHHLPQDKSVICSSYFLISEI